MGLSQAISNDLSDSVASHERRGFDFASVKLTPPLVLAISLLYIIASDGQVDDAESSQIQSVVGQNDALVQFASEYVRHVALKTFLSRAKQGLSHRDKMCILSNVCDAMLSDGVILDIENKTFELLLAAFGLKVKDFANHYETLKIKNDKSVLGYFSVAASGTSMTPHLALAVSVLYMMSADGSIDKHEIGRLETLVAEFDGLQSLAVAYVKQTKRERFIQEAAYALNEAQKLFILLSVYDTMSADGVIALTEGKIFDALLLAFGFSHTTLASYVQVLEDKNLKPFDMRKDNVDQLFESMVSEQNMRHAAVGHEAEENLAATVSRAMQDNVVQVNQSIGASSNVVQIQSNAMGELNLQKVEAANDATHRELIEVSDASDNRQRLESELSELHREAVRSDALVDLRASFDARVPSTNRQKVAEILSGTQQHGVAVEIRIDHLHDDIEALHTQLTAFEHKHQKWLSIGKIFQQAEKNRQKIAPNSNLLSDCGLGGQSAGLATEKVEAPTPNATTAALVSVNSVLLEGWLDRAPTTDANQSDAYSRSRGAGGLSHQGRVLDMVHRAMRLNLKAWVVMLSMLACVSNLGAHKPEQAKGVRGVLQRLDFSEPMPGLSVALPMSP